VLYDVRLLDCEVQAAPVITSTALGYAGVALLGVPLPGENPGSAHVLPNNGAVVAYEGETHDGSTPCFRSAFSKESRKPGTGSSKAYTPWFFAW